MNLLDKLIQSLNKTTESIQPQPDCWIGNYPNDNHDGDFCRSCCQKHVDTLLSGFHPSTEDDVKSTPLNKSELEAIEFAPPLLTVVGVLKMIDYLFVLLVGAGLPLLLPIVPLFLN